MFYLQLSDYANFAQDFKFLKGTHGASGLLIFPAGPGRNFDPLLKAAQSRLKSYIQGFSTTRNLLRLVSKLYMLCNIYITLGLASRCSENGQNTPKYGSKSCIQGFLTTGNLYRLVSKLSMLCIYMLGQFRLVDYVKYGQNTSKNGSESPKNKYIWGFDPPPSPLCSSLYAIYCIIL